MFVLGFISIEGTKSSALSKVNDGFTLLDLSTRSNFISDLHPHNVHEMTLTLQNLPNYDEDVNFQALALKDVEFARRYTIYPPRSGLTCE